MRVLLAAASFASTISGIQRHALNMVRCLLLRQEVTAVHLVVAPWQCAMVESAELPADRRLKMQVADIDRGSLSRNLWYYRELPRLAESWAPMLFISRIRCLWMRDPSVAPRWSRCTICIRMNSR